MVSVVPFFQFVEVHALLDAGQRGAMMDGFNARNGVSGDCFQGSMALPLEQKHRPFNLIFETLARALFIDQVAAVVTALDIIIGSCPGFIAHAQHL